MPWYITGLCEGEACFMVSFSLRKKLKLGIEVRPSFSISQHRRNLKIVKLVRQFFGVGAIRFSKADQNYKYEVRRVSDLMRVIIPHFQRYPLQSFKLRDFEKFVAVCKLVHKSKHRSRAGLEEIIHLAYQMNPAGKRRYQKGELLRLLGKVKE